MLQMVETIGPFNTVYHVREGGTNCQIITLQYLRSKTLYIEKTSIDATKVTQVVPALSCCQASLFIRKESTREFYSLRHWIGCHAHNARLCCALSRRVWPYQDRSFRRLPWSVHLSCRRRYLAFVDLFCRHFLSSTHTICLCRTLFSFESNAIATVGHSNSRGKSMWQSAVTTWFRKVTPLPQLINQAEETS